jgi:hypothetical protein
MFYRSIILLLVLVIAASCRNDKRADKGLECLELINSCPCRSFTTQTDCALGASEVTLDDTTIIQIASDCTSGSSFCYSIERKMQNGTKKWSIPLCRASLPVKIFLSNLKSEKAVLAELCFPISTEETYIHLLQDSRASSTYMFSPERGVLMEHQPEYQTSYAYFVVGYNGELNMRRIPSAKWCWRNMSTGLKYVWGHGVRFRMNADYSAMAPTLRQVLIDTPDAAFLLALDTEGKEHFKVIIKGDELVHISNIFLLDQDSPIIIGTFTGSLEINSENVHESGGGGEYIFIATIAENELKWSRIIGPVQTLSEGGIASDLVDDGTIVIVATCARTSGFWEKGNRMCTFRGKGLIGMAIDASGSLLWAEPIGRGMVWPLTALVLASDLYIVGFSKFGFECGTSTAVPDQTMFSLLVRHSAIK